MSRVLMFLVGITFVGGGTYIAKSSLEAKNMLESAMFGLMGVAIGLFLLICAIAGPPVQ